MSTVMYAYRIPKDRWWEIAAEIRKLYLSEKHPIGAILAKCRETRAAQDYDTMEKAERLLHNFLRLRDHHAALQVFEHGDEYIVRAIENSYFFMNNYRAIDGIAECFYDDRADMTAEMRALEPLVDEIDKLMNAHRYFMWPIFNENSVFSEDVWSNYA